MLCSGATCAQAELSDGERSSCLTQKRYPQCEVCQLLSAEAETTGRIRQSLIVLYCGAKCTQAAVLAMLSAQRLSDSRTCHGVSSDAGRG